MKQFLNKVGWFLLPLVALSLVAELGLRQIENGYKFKKRYLDNHAQDIEVLILGSSHGYYDVNPEYIDGHAFNAGAVSQSFDLDLAILEKYEDNFHELKTIVLPVSYFSFYGKLSEGAERWRMKDYVLYYNLDISSTLKDHFEIFSIKPKNNLRKLLKHYIEHTEVKPYYPLGWGNNYQDKGGTGLEKSGIEASKRHTETDLLSERSKDLYKQSTQDLMHIVEWAGKRNIQILLFIPPGYESYVSHLNQDQLNQVTSELDKLLKQNKNCIYLDFLNDPSFNEVDFYDADHLNHSGAAKLTVKLNKTIGL